MCKIAIFLITRSVAPVLMISRGSYGGGGGGGGRVGIHLNSCVNIHTSCFEVLRVASTSVQVHRNHA